MKTVQTFLAHDAVSMKCPVKQDVVPLSECERCRRGFVVKTRGQAESVICHVDEANPLTVRSVMKEKLAAVRPSTTLEQLILLFIDEDLSAVPVVDEHHQLLGVVSKTDLVFDDYEWAELRDEALSLRRVGPTQNLDTEEDRHVSALFESKRVADIMTDEPVTVGLDTPVPEAARKMVERHVHGCPVLAPDGTLVGMVTTFDITEWVARYG